MLKPEVVIVVKKGMVVAVGTTREDLSYRLIDLDCEKTDRTKDYEADATEIDAEEYTKEVLNEK